MRTSFLLLFRPLAAGTGLLLAMALSLAVPAQAQPGTGGPTGGPTGPDPVPLDGGISLLLAAGVGLGLKRLRRRRNAPHTPPATPIN